MTSKISDLFEPNKTLFSFEFFPPKTPKGDDQLLEHVRVLDELRPSFVSVTYGAGGSTREKTENIVRDIASRTGLLTMPHLTCVQQRRADIESVLECFAKQGVRNILALRGDPPAGSDYDWSDSDYRYASDLVTHIREFSQRNSVDFSIGIAGFPEGHPGTPNRVEEMEYLRAKVDAGADFIITQMCFDNHDLYDYRERCELNGINVPICAGIMPITSQSGMARMSELALGMRFPAPLTRMVLRTDGSDEAISRVGVHWATEQSRDLIDNGFSGIHYYTLNKSDATIQIYKTFGVDHSEQLSAPRKLAIISSKRRRA